MSDLDYEEWYWIMRRYLGEEGFMVVFDWYHDQVKEGRSYEEITERPEIVEPLKRFLSQMEEESEE